MEAAGYYREVGRRLRRKRQMLGVSQETLARRAGLPQSQLSRLERGDFHQMDVWQLKQLCDVLLTTPNFVLGFSDDPGEVPLSVRLGERTMPEASAALPAPIP